MAGWGGKVRRRKMDGWMDGYMHACMNGWIRERDEWLNW